MTDYLDLARRALAELPQAPTYPDAGIPSLDKAALRHTEPVDDYCALPLENGLLDESGWPFNAVLPDEIPSCPHCRLQEAWQPPARDLFGRTPGTWRCIHCDPPTAAIKFRECTERIRRRCNIRPYPWTD
jgi:hypothetical protein